VTINKKARVRALFRMLANPARPFPSASSIHIHQTHPPHPVTMSDNHEGLAPSVANLFRARAALGQQHAPLPPLPQTQTQTSASPSSAPTPTPAADTDVERNVNVEKHTEDKEETAEQSETQGVEPMKEKDADDEQVDEKDEASEVQDEHQEVLDGGVEEEEEQREEADAVPELRSEMSLSKLQMSPRDGCETSPQPPSPLSVGSSSASSSANNSRLQSPGIVSRSSHDRPDFEQAIDLSVHSIDYPSGRSSPAISSSSSTGSPLKQPTLRARAASVESRGVQFSVPSSQPTPTTTPAATACSTPNHIGLASRSVSGSLVSLPGSAVGSPLPSPMASPRATSLSPFQQHHSSVATTAENSGTASSPFMSSPTSPLISQSHTPNPVLDESTMTSVPNTPANSAIHPNSSTTTPAPTPLTLSGPGVSLSQMSTADVSLRFLSATGIGQDPSRRELNKTTSTNLNTPMNTPAVTPAPSVPSTPRLQPSMAIPTAGVRKGSFGSGQVYTVSSSGSSLRVRTHSGSTSPSPATSPAILSGLPMRKLNSRSASIDRSDLSARLESSTVSEEGDSDELTVDNGKISRKNSSAARSSTSASTLSPSTSSPTLSGKEKQEATLLLRLDQLFSRHFGRLNVIVSQERMEMAAAERTRMEQLTPQITAALNQSIDEQLKEIVPSIVRSSIETSLESIIPSMERHITRAVESALASSPTGKPASSASTEQLSASIVSALRTPIQDGFRIAFTSTLLPSFEQSTKTMLQQIQRSVNANVQAAATSAATAALAHSHSPSKGEQEKRDKEAAVARKKEEDAERRRAAEAAQRDAREKQMAAEARSAADAHAKQMNELQKMMMAMAAQQSALMREVTALKQAQQDTAQRMQTSATPAAVTSPSSSASSTSPVSSTSTSSTPSTPDQHLMPLLVSYRFNDAFTFALSRGDLSIVLAACKRVDPRKLFTSTNPEHQLTKHVKLSLLQQLTVGLEENMNATHEEMRLKLAWIVECVMSMNAPVDDAILASHVRRILQELSQTLDKLASSPSMSRHRHPLHDEFRMLPQLVQAKLAATPTL